MSGRHLVDCPQPIKRSWVSDERQELRDDVDEALSAVTNVEIGGDVSLHLGIASA